MLITYVLHVDDKPGVLNRVSSLVRRRDYNIESLTVGHTAEAGVSRITLVVDANPEAAHRIEANLYKLVHVLRVENLTEVPAVYRHLALIKVAASVDTRTQIMQLADVFRGRVVDVAPDSLMIEITGTDGRLSLSTFGSEPVLLETPQGPETFDLPNPTHIQQPLIQSLVNALRGQGQCPSTGETAARTSCVMDAVLDDYYGGRDDAFWNRPATWPGRK